MPQDPKRPAHYSGDGREDIVDPRTYGKMHGLNFDQISAIKYITRFGKKGGVADLLRDTECAIHYIELFRDDHAKPADVRVQKRLEAILAEDDVNGVFLGNQ